MQKDHKFNHHAKCEKLSLTNLTFADDVLLFSIGDQKSVEMMLDTSKKFSESTNLIVNPNKPKIYYGGINDITKGSLINMTCFEEGHIPVRYLGVPLSRKKLSMNHYLPLVERIMGRVNYWTTKLLSIACRTQLVKSISHSIAQYWMKYFLIPKMVIQKIDFICRSFIWTGNSKISRKYPVAWKKTCSPIKQGGFNVINFEVWNTVTLLKCLWNLCRKVDSMWVMWIHVYYLKGKDVMNADISSNSF
ncbi:unnamed protein product [Lathyrus oleraceus]